MNDNLETKDMTPAMKELISEIDEVKSCVDLFALLVDKTVLV